MKIELELIPFITPDFVLIKMPPMSRRAGFQENPRIPLSELSGSQLNELCAAFRASVFEKARLKEGQPASGGIVRGNAASGR